MTCPYKIISKTLIINMKTGAKLCFSFDELNQEPNGAFYEHLKKPIVQNYCSTNMRSGSADISTNLFEIYYHELNLPSKQNRSIWEGCPNKNENDMLHRVSLQSHKK